MVNPILAIDPGSEKSAYVIWDGEEIERMEILNNEDLLDMLMYEPVSADIVVCERIANMGMSAVGESIFETVFWTGRFCQAWGDHLFVRVKRSEIKMHLCGSMRARDPNIRRALIDRFEPDLKPRQRPKGILKGVHDDIWAAMGVAVTYWDLNVEAK